MKFSLSLRDVHPLVCFYEVHVWEALFTCISASSFFNKGLLVILTQNSTGLVMWFPFSVNSSWISIISVANAATIQLKTDLALFENSNRLLIFNALAIPAIKPSFRINSSNLAAKLSINLFMKPLWSPTSEPAAFPHLSHPSKVSVSPERHLQLTLNHRSCIFVPAILSSDSSSVL